MAIEKWEKRVLWYAVHTKPRQEDIAEASLHELGLQTFSPRLKERKIVRGVRQDVVKPLFPGYIFTKFRCDQWLRAVKYARGVRRVVGAGDVPTPVDEEIVHIIHSRMKGGYVMIEPPPLRPGDAVVVEEGPLRGFVGIFERQMKGSERVVVLLNTIKFQARVILEREELRRLEGADPEQR
jgi:transcription elongation factor/antiterminator RfaH